MKDEFCSQFATLRQKTYYFFSEGNDGNKKKKS